MTPRRNKSISVFGGSSPNIVHFSRELSSVSAIFCYWLSTLPSLRRKPVIAKLKVYDLNLMLRRYAPLTFSILLLAPLFAFAQSNGLDEKIDELFSTLDTIGSRLGALDPQEQSVARNEAAGSTYAGTEICTDIHGPMGYGSRDTGEFNYVSDLQRFLSSTGDFTYPRITGYYGDATVAAVKRFQAREGIVSSGSPGTTGYGLAGPKTRERVRELSCGGLELLSGPNGAGIIDFGFRLEIGESRTATVYAVPGSGYVSVTNVSLSEPFEFTGGSYPGAGGTCGEVITGTCTLSVSFEPTGDNAKGQEGSVLTYEDDLALSYSTSGGTRTSSVLLEGRSTVLGSLSLRMPHNFGATITDEPITRTVTLAALGGDVSEMDIPSSLPEPFELSDSSCGTELAEKEQCEIEIVFEPGDDELSEYELEVDYRVANTEKTARQALVAEKYSPDPSEHLLIVYNRFSNDSTEVKDYYIENRPGFENANVLGVSFATNVFCGETYEGEGATCPESNAEQASRAEFESRIMRPILDWLADNPEKNIHHIVLMYGLPTRVVKEGGARGMFGTGYHAGISAQHVLSRAMIRGASLYDSVGGSEFDNNNTYNGVRTLFTPALYPATPAIVTQLHMGSVEATKAYIDKIADVYNEMSDPNVVVSGTDAGIAGDTYYFDYANIGNSNITNSLQNAFDAGVQSYDEAVLEENPSADVVHRGFDDSPIRSFDDVLGYFGFGQHAGMGRNWSGNLSFRGRSGWYIMSSGESFNGLLFPAGSDTGRYQEHFPRWFRQDAFGGSGYANTPIGASVTVSEPGIGGLVESEFFTCWEQGELLIDCGWAGKGSSATMLVGDPYVTK